MKEILGMLEEEGEGRGEGRGEGVNSNLIDGID